MTSDQLRKLLDEAALSQRGAARELEIDERTMRRYCAGELPVPRAIEYALRWLIVVADARQDFIFKVERIVEKIEDVASGGIKPDQLLEILRNGDSPA